MTKFKGIDLWPSGLTGKEQFRRTMGRCSIFVRQRNAIPSSDWTWNTQPLLLALRIKIDSGLLVRTYAISIKKPSYSLLDFSPNTDMDVDIIQDSDSPALSVSLFSPSLDTWFSPFSRSVLISSFLCHLGIFFVFSGLASSWRLWTQASLLGTTDGQRTHSGDQTKQASGRNKESALKNSFGPADSKREGSWIGWGPERPLGGEREKRENSLLSRASPGWASDCKRGCVESFELGNQGKLRKRNDVPRRRGHVCNDNTQDRS